MPVADQLLSSIAVSTSCPVTPSACARSPAAGICNCCIMRASKWLEDGSAYLQQPTVTVLLEHPVCECCEVVPLCIARVQGVVCCCACLGQQRHLQQQHDSRMGAP